MRAPRFYDWGGGPGVPVRWSFGWYLEDIDLVCVVPGPLEHWQGERALCPVASSKPLALLSFLLKRILLRIDHNLRR